jgi:DNA-binding transcriptional MerR regulator
MRPLTPEKPWWWAWWFGAVVAGVEVFMIRTLTVEPGFKSTEIMNGELATIGDVARRAGVATSTVRYYERRGLLQPDGRQSGQRRYRDDTLRLLIFIGMLQDAGLSLDDIDGILHASAVDEWKEIGQRRLEALDEEIARLQNARSYLQGALLCRFDHPLTECRIMGAEIDRRLE